MNSMANWMCKRLKWPGLWWVVCAAWAFPLLAADQLQWNFAKGQVSADVKNSDINTFLERLVRVTGWQIMVEPDLKYTVSAKFKERTPGEALRLLFGNLNFALVPQSPIGSKLFVFRTAMDEATLEIRPARDPDTRYSLIPDELVVTAKSGTDLEQLAKSLGAKIVGRSDDLNAVRLKFADEASAKAAREKLKENAAVTNVDANYQVPRPISGDPLQLGSANQLQLQAKPLGSGNPVLIGMIDTPVQSLGGNLEGLMLKPVSLSGDTQVSQTEPTHGTTMAGTLLRGLQATLEDGKATGVRIQPFDVYGDKENTTTFEVGLGIQAAIKGNANIISLSLGGDGDSSYLHALIQAARSQNILIFAAAGNNAATTPTYPAAYPEVIAVTAGDRRGNLADYANHGDFVDVVAPGTSIVNFGNQTYIVTGTSAATAYAAGVAAGIADRTGKTAAEIDLIIRQNLSMTKP
jgi:hypothetical protein